MRSPRSGSRTHVHLDGYVRVSRVGKRRGPRFISPAVQREAIEDWAARNGFKLVEVFEELDESGMCRDRPLLELAIRRIEEGASAGLAVWRVDRFGRSLNDGVQIIERVRQVGGKFYSVQDGLDIDTEAGRLALRILLSVAEFHLEGLRASWDAAREHAIRRGVHLAKTVPVGYRRTRAGRLRPHPTHGAVMCELYERRAAGESLLTLCRFLEDHGVPTGKGNPGWSPSAMSNLLRSRVYLGEVYHGDYRNRHAHPPLTDAATWQAAQHPRNQRRHETLPAILVRVARCAGCRHAMQPFIARPPGRSPYLNYRCRKFYAAGPCPAPAIITASKLEPYVIEAMLRILRNRRRQPVERVAAAEGKALSAERALDRYRDNDRIALVIGERAFLDGLSIREDRLRTARLELFDARARLKLHRLPPADQVRRQWTAMSVDEQRELVRGVLDAVFVGPGRLPAAQRVTICPAGTGPGWMPRQGDRARALRPIQPRRGWINPKPPATEPLPR